MHHKKSELQIGKESSGVSSDFNPTPPLFPTGVIHTHHPHPPPSNKFLHLQIQIPSSPSSSSSCSSSPQFINNNKKHQNELLSTPHKRPIMNNHNPRQLSHSPTLSSLQQHHHHHHNKKNGSGSGSGSLPISNTSTSTTTGITNSYCPFHLHFQIPFSTKVHFFRIYRYLRRLRLHLRLLLLLSFPSFYFFLSNPNRSFFLDFLSAIAFSAVLLVSLNLALPRLPSIRLFFARSFPIKLTSVTTPSSRTSSSPVFWSIGSRPKAEKLVNSGSGVQVYNNGDVYEGEFHKGKCSGSGVYYYYMQGRYEGDWVDEKYDGYGVETWAKGSRYRGQYRQGLRHGFGVYRFYTGDVYAGEWSNGQSHGCGVHTCEDGSRYVGEFKWGVKHGLGHYHFRNGDTFAGEYFADKMHGFGVYRFANGHRYEGAWHEGRKQGLGMYTFRNGEAQSGHWQNGILDIPSTQNIHPVSPIAVNHSKVLNAVQEARRAAEKAYDVGRVDERVNKAVAAANKAANAARVAAVKAVQKRMHHHHHNDELPLPIV
ncbi:hypothetical protein IFM89_001289 [Coptis chinensis]|uniref:Uncharacterized protein n=1 Tax=Coptis chinensis TaxID=261450 RepID=A0A835ITZ7_9MAGN|nr:hypothetical protein IFM89_001289 [Coptis chinensis]